MKALIILLFALFANVTVAATAEQEQIENILRIANQQARCLDAVLGSFGSKEEEQLAYSGFYRTLVVSHKRFVEISLKSEESGMPKILEYVGSIDILVGMLMQGTIVSAAEYNDQHDSERAGKTLAQFQRFLWNVNGCDAIYSGM